MSSANSILDKPVLQNSTRPLLVGLLIIVLLMGISTGLGIFQLRDMADTLQQVSREDEVARKAIYTIQRVTRDRSLLMTEILDIEDPFVRDEKLLEFDRLTAGFIEAMQRQRTLSSTPEEKAVLARQLEFIQSLIVHFENVVDLARRGDLALATDYFQNTTIPVQSQMLDATMKWSELHYDQHTKRVETAKRKQQQVIKMMILVALISTMVAFGVAWIVYRWNNRLISRYVVNEQHLRDSLAEVAFRQQALDAHSIISVAEVDGRITHVNDKFCEISGYSHDELIGANHRILKSDYHSSAFFQDMMDTISRGHVWFGEIKNRAKNGRYYWVQTSIVPMLDESGLPIRYISVRTDITHLKEMEESVRKANVILQSNVLERTKELELAKQQLEKELVERSKTQEALQRSFDELKVLHRQLQEAQQYLMQSEKLAAVGQLAAGMAHEINNPIGFIKSNLATLSRYQETLGSVLNRYIKHEEDLDESVRTELTAFRKQADLDFLLEDTRELLEESRGGVERVRKIVQSLRDFSKVDSLENKQLVDINHSLDTTIDILGERFAKDVIIQREYGELPQVECSVASINQVFVSLLNNALQAIPGSGQITLRSGVDGEQVWVEVEDTGVGITEDVLPHIFDPFFTTRAVGDGAGLGLSTSFGIIQKHHGQITVSTKVGSGTTFRVILPLRQNEVVLEKANAV